MTVYVDEIRDHTTAARLKGLRHTHWCHLTADTETELHAFAARLGLRRSWYQKRGPADYRWHYDITPPKRAQALRLGAVEIDRHGLAALMATRRTAAGLKETAVVSPRCGNNPNVRLTEADRATVAEVREYLRQRKAQP